MSDEIPENLPRANAWKMTNDIMAATSQAFTDSSGDGLRSLPYRITDIIGNELEQRDARVIREIAGPPAMNPPRPVPAPPPPSRELLMKYIAHVSELAGSKFLISFRHSSVRFTEEEMTELYRLEATFHTGGKLE